MNLSNRGMAINKRRFQHNHCQEPEGMRYSYAFQALSNHNNNDTASTVLIALENFSVKMSVQQLAHTALGSIQEFDGKDKSATIPWLDEVKSVAEKTGNDPVEVGISKLMGLALGDVKTIRKEEGLTWHKFRNILIKNYSNVPYDSDAMVAYSHLTQQDDESTSQYLIRA